LFSPDDYQNKGAAPAHRVR